MGSVSLKDKQGRTPLKVAKGEAVAINQNFIKGISSGRRLIAQTPEPLVEVDQLTSNIETPAIAESSPVPALLFVVLALFIGYLFFRCVKARRTKSLAYPLGLLGGETE